MRIALWDIDPFAESTERFSELGWNVRLVSPADCGRALLEAEVDIALVPSIEVLKDTLAFSILPGVAFASKRRFPYIGLRLNRPVIEVRTILASRNAEPFYGIASIVLREQYECRTSMVREGEADSRLEFGGAVAGGEDRLDVGLEWFEMTGMPLAWGFFCVKPGTVPDSRLAAIQDELAGTLDTRQGVLDDDSTAGGATGANLLVGYDPEVSEGIDELAHYLFYVGILDDIPALRLMAAQN